MAFQIKCLYTVDSKEVDLATEHGEYTDLSIELDKHKLVLSFNKFNLKRTIPYFIHCLNNNKEYTLQFGDDSTISYTEGNITCRIEHGGSYSEIDIPYEYKGALIHALNKYKCVDINKNYINIMDRAMRINCRDCKILFTTFDVDYNDTGMLIIHNITDNEKAQFKLLCNKNIIEITVRDAYYKCNRTGDITRNYDCHNYKSICNYLDFDIQYALNHILDTN